MSARLFIIDIVLSYHKVSNSDFQGHFYKKINWRLINSFLWHFVIASILRWCLIFDGLVLHLFTKYYNYIWVRWFWAKNLLFFCISSCVFLPGKCYNPYFHNPDEYDYQDNGEQFFISDSKYTTSGSLLNDLRQGYENIILYKTFCLDRYIDNEVNLQYGNTGCGVFKRGVKINIFKGNYWMLRIGSMGKCQKYQNLTKIWLLKLIFNVKNYSNLSQFFFRWRISI